LRQVAAQEHDAVGVVDEADQTTILDDSEQYLRAREAEAMCDHVWIFEARTLSTQPVRRRCGMCGVYRMEPRCREPGIQTHGGPDQEKPSGLAPRAALGVALVLEGDQAL
jgi:hypothetical protein